ncbi:Chimaerin and related Rho GTPase activating proteins [Ceraceosorus bombacis]|uniref:Chimaerin and related Rho GTPase activating proteins n=1 Tax=Ceraceosorus bombacis TaxID=401625 RepID=A0A0P1BGZ5_9BASI|nr:Chimaerin and related Rho GTPase activating proteins [Ceraceosorus bombacis]
MPPPSNGAPSASINSAIPPSAQSQAQQSQSQSGIGRSQSAFNFLISKAKGTFSSGGATNHPGTSLGNQHGLYASGGGGHGAINASASMSSLASQPVFEEGPDHASLPSNMHPGVFQGASRSRVASGSSSGASAGGGGGGNSSPSGIAIGSAAGGSSGVYQNFAIERGGSVTDFGRYPTTNRPSFGAEDAITVSSPTKRSFFGGHRDRKTSNASVTKNSPTLAINPPSAGSNASRGGYAHSPLSRGANLRQDSLGSNGNSGAPGLGYAQFSRSQSDLSHRHEFPSPTIGNAELPRPFGQTAASNLPVNFLGSDDPQHLRSPSPNIGYSRSVDDLNHAATPPLTAATTGSAGKAAAVRQHQPQQHRTDATWGEHGVPAADWGRPSEVGALSSRSAVGNQAQQLQRWNANSSGGSPHVPVSQQTPQTIAGPAQGYQSQSPALGGGAHIPFSSAPQSSTWPQVPPIPPQHLGSTPNKHSRKGSKQGALREAGTAMGLPFVSRPQDDASHGTSLPSGATYQGFLNRNANISLPLSQLQEGGDKGREREKDLSKGWKPYKVILREGRLYFFKPPSSISDDVKALFPTSLVRPIAGTTAPVDLDAIKKALAQQELLAATASSQGRSAGAPRTSTARPATKRGDSGAGAPPNIATPTTSEAREPPAMEASSSWAAPGKHPDLSLAETVTPPASWIERIVASPMESLAHELVFATQFSVGSSSATAATAQPKDGTERSDEVETYVLSLLIATARSGRPIQKVLVAVQKWAVEALSLGVEDELAGSLITDASSPVVLKFKAEVRERLAAVAMSRPLDYASDDNDRRGAAEVLQALVDMTSSGAEAEKARHSVLSVLVQDAVEQHHSVPKAPDWIEAIRGRASRDHLHDIVRHKLSPSSFLNLEPPEIAQQLQIFHADRLRSFLAPTLSIGRLFSRSNALNSGLLSFDASRPHFITRLVMDQLFDEAIETGPQSTARRPESGNTARHRAAIMRHWIAIASYLLTFGDLVGWAAVTAALCSRPVSRLDQTWRYVASNDRTIVSKTWAPQLAKLGWTDGNEGPDCQIAPLIINVSSASAASGSADSLDVVEGNNGKRVETLPFLGNVFVDHSDDQQGHAAPLANQLDVVSSLQAARRSLALGETWLKQYGPPEQERTSARTYPGVAPAIPEQQRAFLSLLELSSKGEWSQSTQSTEELGLSRYMSPSLATEPRSLGRVDHRWHAPMTEVTVACALAPLLFTETLPTLTLLDRDRVINLITGPSQLGNSSTSSANSRRLKSIQAEDNEATVRAHKGARPTLAGSPLLRSRTFPPTSRSNAKGVPFSGIAEWDSNRRGSLGGEPTVFKIGAELVVTVVAEAGTTSAPGTPMTSKRFSQEMGNATRPLSQVSKRSSLPASNRSSIVEASSTPVSVVISAATLERLVDVLVLGVQHVTVLPLSDDHGETPLSNQRRWRLSMDLPHFRAIFLTTYRRLCTPIVLFDYLAKRFAGAVQASREMALPAQHRSANQFPSWARADPVGSRMEPIDWEFVSRIRLGVITVLREWAQRCPQDFADDAELFDGALNFAKSPPGLNPRHEDDPDYGLVVSVVDDLLLKLRTSAMCANTRPSDMPPGAEHFNLVRNSDGSTNPNHMDTMGTDLDFDRTSAPDLVRFLESIAAVFFDKITQRDLLVASEMFERQSSVATGWHVRSATPATGADDSTQTNNMYKLLEFLRAPGEGKDSPSLHQTLPPALRDACAAQNMLRGWIAIHIIESRIGLQRRQSRLAKLLDAVWICRTRMSRVRSEDTVNTSFAAPGPFKETTVTSFVESVIVGALTASESRIFQRAWHGVAASREATGETFEGLFPPARVASAYSGATNAQSTPDVGWILKSLAETVTRQSEHIHANSALLDFDKSRTIYNLIESSLRIRPVEIEAKVIEIASARLNAMQAALRKVGWDRRAFKDDAAQESAGAPALPAKFKPTKPLVALTSEQQEKQRRDRMAYEILLHVAKEPVRISSPQAAPMRPSLSVGNTPQPGLHVGGTPASATATAPIEKRARRMTALFRGAIRPSADKADTPQRTAAQLLELTPTMKHAVIIGAASAQASLWSNNQRSFVFHLSSPESGNHVLQAPSQMETVEWLREIQKAASQYAAPRSGDPSKSAALKGKAVMPLYNIDLMTLAARDKRSVPLGLERMLAEVEARGLLEQGIYRISGAKNAIEGLKIAFSKQPAESVELSTGEYSDVHTIAGAIKQWLRDLPEPVVPFQHYNALIEAERVENYEDRLYAIRDIIWEFPQPHFEVLRRMSEHLARICEEGERNLMAPHNIGLVFGTSLLNPPPGPASVAQSFGNIGKAAHIVKLIVTTHEWLFEPEPPEVGVEAEATLVEEDVPPTFAPAPAPPASDGQEAGSTPHSPVGVIVTESAAPADTAGTSGHNLAPALGAAHQDASLPAEASQRSASSFSASAAAPAPILPKEATFPRGEVSALGLSPRAVQTTLHTPQKRAPGAREGTESREESIYLDAREALNALMDGDAAEGRFDS